MHQCYRQLNIQVIERDELGSYSDAHSHLKLHTGIQLCYIASIRIETKMKKIRQVYPAKGRLKFTRWALMQIFLSPSFKYFMKYIRRTSE